MSYLIIDGTNVAVGQMSGGRNVCGRNVCGTYVCRTKVAPPDSAVYRNLIDNFFLSGRLHPGFNRQLQRLCRISAATGNLPVPTSGIQSGCCPGRKPGRLYRGRRTQSRSTSLWLGNRFIGQYITYEFLV